MGGIERKIGDGGLCDWRLIAPSIIAATARGRGGENLKTLIFSFCRWRPYPL